MANLEASVRIHWRLIDDCFVVRACVDTVLACMNLAENNKFVVTHDSDEGPFPGHFLDFAYQTSDEGCIYYETFVKPLAAFNFVPYYSLHPRNTLDGTPRTAFHRLRVTNSSQSSCDRLRQFYARKLLDRGYDAAVVKKALIEKSWINKCNLIPTGALTDFRVLEVVKV